MSAAAYVQVGIMRDRNTGEVFNFRHGKKKKRDAAIDLGIALPGDKTLMDDTDQSGKIYADFWSEVDRIETHKNARIAHTWVLPLPKENSLDANAATVSEWQHWMANRYKIAVMVVIHAEDPNNPHAHVMATTRCVNEDGSLAKNKYGPARVLGNNKLMKAEGKIIGEAWAEAINRHLPKGVERVTHLSFAERGIKRPKGRHDRMAWKAKREFEEAQRKLKKTHEKSARLLKAAERLMEERARARRQRKKDEIMSTEELMRAVWQDALNMLFGAIFTLRAKAEEALAEARIASAEQRLEKIKTERAKAEQAKKRRESDGRRLEGRKHYAKWEVEALRGISAKTAAERLGLERVTGAAHGIDLLCAHGMDFLPACRKLDATFPEVLAKAKAERTAAKQKSNQPAGKSATADEPLRPEELDPFTRIDEPRPKPLPKPKKPMAADEPLRPEELNPFTRINEPRPKPLPHPTKGKRKELPESIGRGQPRKPAEKRLGVFAIPSTPEDRPSQNAPAPAPAAPKTQTPRKRAEQKPARPAIAAADVAAYQAHWNECMRVSKSANQCARAVGLRMKSLGYSRALVQELLDQDGFGREIIMWVDSPQGSQALELLAEHREAWRRCDDAARLGAGSEQAPRQNDPGPRPEGGLK